MKEKEETLLEIYTRVYPDFFEHERIVNIPFENLNVSHHGHCLEASPADMKYLFGKPELNVDGEIHEFLYKFRFTKEPFDTFSLLAQEKKARLPRKRYVNWYVFTSSLEKDNRVINYVSKLFRHLFPEEGYLGVYQFIPHNTKENDS